MTGFFGFLGVLLIAGIIVVPIVLISMVSGIKGQIDVINRRIMQLSQDIKNMAKPTEEKVVETKPVAEPQPQPAETVAVPYSTVDHSAYMPREIVTEEPQSEPEIQEVFVSGLLETPVLKIETELIESSEPEIIVKETVIIPEHEPIIEPIVYKKPVGQPYTQLQKPTPKESFNFERFIGENLINKIGIGVLVIGIGLFVKYAIENDWINEIARVVIGFLSGGVLLGLAYYFRNTYRAFSSVLTGGAVVVFYFTVAIAFREYNLFGQTASFLMMVGITAFSVWLSILYDRRELAVVSLIGGMLTPFLVSRGDDNYHVLFTYIAILNVGMLALSLRKQWKELLVISFAGTQLIFWLFYLRDTNIFRITANDITRDTALLVYASVFYIIFLMMPLIQVFRNREQPKDHALHIILLIVNSLLHLLAGVLLLKRMNAESYQGLLTALLAVINGTVAALLYNNKKDKILFHLFTGLTVSFVTLAAPLQFDGNNITLFWATEAVLLLWLFRKSNAVIYYMGSLILLALSFISIVQLHHLQPLGYEGQIRATEGSVLINSYFITRLYTSLAFVICGLLLRRHYSEHQENKLTTNWLPTIIGSIAAAMLFYTGNRELYMFTNTDITSFWKMAYFFCFAYALSVIIGQKALVCQFKFIAVIILWAVGCLRFWGQNDFTWQLKYTSSAIPFVLYWIGFAGLIGLFMVVAHIFYTKYPLKSSQGKTMMWFFNVVAIICLSIATVEAINQITTSKHLDISNKATVTILWSLCAFAQMWLGMQFKYKTLRIISLSLLGLVLCKLFLYDLIAVSQGAKIVALVVLGVVLLVLSFMYQKLKKILFEEE